MKNQENQEPAGAGASSDSRRPQGAGAGRREAPAMRVEAFFSLRAPHHPSSRRRGTPPPHSWSEASTGAGPLRASQLSAKDLD